MTRLKSLHLKDFRSINGDVNVSLDAPIVLIHGPNGAGKTSLLSAIELALTGNIPSLSRAEPGYLSYLPHKDSDFGHVSLEIENSDGQLQKTEMKVTANEVIGTPLLKPDDATFFSERSYLAQSTLGRLLEIYQHSERKDDSPLTRFVKELLGLDRMEALISGLYPAGNVTRLKSPVPAYAEVRAAIKAREDEIKELTLQVQEARKDAEEGKSGLQNQLNDLDSSLSKLEMSDLIEALEDDPEELEQQVLLDARRELNVSRNSWSKNFNTQETANRVSLEAEDRSARHAMQIWSSNHELRIGQLLTKAADFFADFSVASETAYLERAQLLEKRLTDDLQRIERIVSSHEESLTLRDQLAQKLREARSRRNRIDEELSSASQTNETIAKALSQLTAEIHDNTCPVCDRNYSEVSTKPLASHVSEKVAAMVEQAGRIQSLTESRRTYQTEIKNLEVEVERVEREMVADSELNDLKSRSVDVHEVRRQLQSERAQFQEGDQLRTARNSAARRLMTLKNADETAMVLRNSLIELGEDLGLEVEGSETPLQLMESIHQIIEERQVELKSKQDARTNALDAAEALIEAQNKSEKIGAILAAKESELAALEMKKSDADEVIEIGKEVTRRTHEARNSVMRRVFSDELNTIWRDLFVRLAPEEPFIPAFAIPDSANAKIEAVLETHYRHGGKGGNPRAMLSAGNLNTAALTLFLALHLSVAPRLPWLVIDDPVQSMDEVHIAQFAALLRTLSKQVKRQVVIAVHERSLFDYLALELSPAFDGDSLNVIELGRNSVGETTCRWEPRFYVPDQALAS